MLVGLIIRYHKKWRDETLPTSYDDKTTTKQDTAQQNRVHIVWDILYVAKH